LRWANCQYLAHSAPPEVLDVDVHVSVVGHTVTQARAIGTVGEREVLHVQASLGAASAAFGGVWATMPDVPPPADCPPRKTPHHLPGTFSSRVEQRVALGEWGRARRSEGGRTALWVRLPDGIAFDAAGLGVIGDFVPSGVAAALEADAGGASLDNTLRVVRLVDTEWVLCDIRIDAVADGFGHGTVHQWAEDGTLLAVAGQTSIVKPRA
jgi:acyl-CoA thioesterase